MTTTNAKLVPIEVTPGVQPITDRTPFSTTHFTASDKIRFRFGFPEKIGGWVSIPFDYSEAMTGKVRTIYSDVLGTKTLAVLGSHKKLYSLVGSRLTNITPLTTSTTTIANSLDTDYGTLANNPITTVAGSNILTIADTNAALYKSGDSVTLSGASDVGGITAATYINSAHVIQIAGATSYTIVVGAAASSSATGGGASVVRATGRLRVSATAHGQANGDRVKLAAAADTGGIVAATNINKEFVIRNVLTDSFDVITGGVASSAVTGGGGASTTYQKEIPAGAEDEAFGSGYGMGLYGTGLYGTARSSMSGKSFPRIWFVDRYGDNLVMTPGNGTGVYSWAGDTTTAPALVANAPTNVNYCFVSDNILVTFGAGGYGNRVFSSDQGDITVWTGSSVNQVYDDNIEGAGRLMSHAPVAGRNLIFTNSQTYLFSYIGLPLVWKTELIDNSIGIIAPLARCVVNGVAYWMGQSNFYRWAGGNIEIIPANSQIESTILRYVYTNLTSSQRSKIFCWYNEQFNEIWWHYPADGSDEPDRIARLNVQDLTWCPDTMDRTAAEYPRLSIGYPRLASSAATLYRHEYGTDADGETLPWTLTSNFRFSGKMNALLSGVIPDSAQDGSITLTVTARQFPQSPQATYVTSYQITPTTERVTTQSLGRFWQYQWSGDELGNAWKMGGWLEYIQEGSPN